MQLSEQELKGIFAEYMEHSYRYYVMDSPVVSDQYYDELCRILIANWGNFEHSCKHLCDESALFAGSGFQMVGKFPQWIECIVYMHPDRPFKETIK